LLPTLSRAAGKDFEAFSFPKPDKEVRRDSFGIYRTSPCILTANRGCPGTGEGRSNIENCVRGRGKRTKIRLTHFEGRT